MPELIIFKKHQVFWPSRDFSFQDIPLEVCHSIQVFDGVELLGAPIFESAKYFDDFTAALFDKVFLYLQYLLSELEDPQVELHLLHHCLKLYMCSVLFLLTYYTTFNFSMTSFIVFLELSELLFPTLLVCRHLFPYN